MVEYRSEMDRNAIESYLRTSKIVASGHFVKTLKKNIVPYGSEMARNAIESEFRTSKMADQSEMARNAIHGNFQTSKMAAGKKKFCIDLKWPKLRSKVNFGNPKWPIDLKWPEMRWKVNFGHSKWPPEAIFLNNVRIDCWPTTSCYKFTFGEYVYIHTDSYVGNEGIYIVFALYIDIELPNCTIRLHLCQIYLHVIAHYRILKQLMDDIAHNTLLYYSRKFNIHS